MAFMYKAISVRKLCATATKAPRLKAFVDDKSLIEERDFKYNYDENMCVVAKKFLEQLGWNGKYHGGEIKNGDYVFVCFAHSDHVDFSNISEYKGV